jgi:hypothetical protein
LGVHFSYLNWGLQQCLVILRPDLKILEVAENPLIMGLEGIISEKRKKENLNDYYEYI